MNRIAQRHFAFESVQGLEALHDLFIRTVASHVPPSVAALYAIPKVDALGNVQWMTSFAGQPVPYGDLSPQAAQSLSTLLFERLHAIKEFSSKYAARPDHDPGVLQHLLDASTEPPVEAVYSVGGQPVILFWDKAIPSLVSRQTLVAPVVPAALSVVQSHRPWWWLLALLLLLLLVWLIWWLWCPRSPLNHVDPLASIVQHVPIAEAPTEPPVTEPVALPETKPEPEPEPPEAVQEPKPEDPPVIDPEPEPVPDPVPEPPPPPPPPPKPKPVVKPPVTISTAKNVCPGERPPELAPEMVVVFDASGSMRVNINATREEELWALNVVNRGVLALQWLSPQERRRLERVISEPTRMMTAQQATVNVLQRLPSDVSSGLVVVDACPTARNLGRYTPAQRNQMISRLRGLSPMHGTPLADGILEAGRLVDGVSKESTILLVSDGGETCGGDPCMVARNLAREKPHLKINVVDIGGSGAAACVAQATGGKVYTVSNIAELNLGIDRAARDALGPTNCKK